MSIMETERVCKHCGKVIGWSSFNNNKEPHDCYMKHLHMKLDAKNKHKKLRKDIKKSYE